MIYKKKPIYKETKTGKMQFHQIMLYDTELDGTYKVTCYYGQSEGKVQTSEELIKRDLQGAQKFVDLKYNNMLKKGYYESEEEAVIDVNKRIRPMLVKTFQQDGKKIKYPCIVQPKLDGIRCIADVVNGVCTLYSRSGKKIKSMNHIKQEVERLAKEKMMFNITLDGELFSELSFESICSIVMKHKTTFESNHIQYHVFDCIDKLPFWQRQVEFEEFCGESVIIKTVPVHRANNEEEIDQLFEQYVEQGMEGLIIRNTDSKYKHNRSFDIQRYKPLADDEFRIIGVESGKGSYADCGIFICETKEGETFKVKCKGTIESLEEYLTNSHKYVGQQLTVEYGNLTKNGIPRFPVGKAIRPEGV